MKISIIVPFYNEEKTIARVLEKLSTISLNGVVKEIIIVNDGSTDKSYEQIKRLKMSNITFLSHEKNLGKGEALKTGIRKATGEFIIIQDADLEYNPDDIQKLIAASKGGKYAVYGTRLKRLPNLRRDERTIRFFIHYVGNRILSFLTSIIYNTWITDMETGYKMLPARFIKAIGLQSKGFEIEAEITVKLLKRGYKIIEVPIKTNPRDYAQGKKLQTIPDGIKACIALLKYRFVD